MAARLIPVPASMGGSRVDSAAWRALGLPVLVAVALVGCGADVPRTKSPGAALSAAAIAYRDLEGETPPWSPDIDPRTVGPTGVDRALTYDQVSTHPRGFRRIVSLGEESWLEAALYTRDPQRPVSDFIDVVPDPAQPAHAVLRLRTLAHTDGLVLRSRRPLPDAYRITFRIGYIAYGGTDPLNGYDAGDETGEPWMSIPAVDHNGVYWGAIMDTLPEPRENIWSHHHRKFFIDTWNYRKRMLGVTVAAVAGKSDTSLRTGKAFIAYDGHEWRGGSVEPAFFYLPNQWYRVRIERAGGEFRFAVTGDFHGIGRDHFEDGVNARQSCVYHYNRKASELDDGCLTGDILDTDAGVVDVWPRDSSYPDYFMLGDPHINFYEGTVLVDDLVLEVL